jgi:upstream activation factor subunit UAF30
MAKKPSQPPKAGAAKAAPAPKEAAKSKPNALQKPLHLSSELAAVTGASTLNRAEVVSKVWEYIKKHDLQNPANRREILADEKLKRVLKSDKVTMFEMTKLLSEHMK